MSRIMNTILEYVWIGGNGERRSKTRIINFLIRNVNDIPNWTSDGSSTGQADSNGMTEIILAPCKYFLNTLLNNKNITCDNYIVLCETFDINMVALPSNYREKALRIFNKGLSEEPWFGIEQEYIMCHTNQKNKDKCLSSDSRHYCGTQLNSVERTIAEEHMSACLYAKIKYAGLNSEVTQSQWEYQIGPCEGIDAADHLTIANFLHICYFPKLFFDKNGSGCHTNFSTYKTRSEGGIKEIRYFMEKLENNHEEHIEVYGENNDKRLTGLHETSSCTHFSYGVGTRNTSVRIPTLVEKDGCGYFEDRRPAANCDPYQVTAIIFKTCCLDFL